jgi:hypothetical protein
MPGDEYDLFSEVLEVASCLMERSEPADRLSEAERWVDKGELGLAVTTCSRCSRTTSCSSRLTLMRTVCPLMVAFLSSHDAFSVVTSAGLNSLGFGPTWRRGCSIEP